jgi:hypothetical protein
VWFSSVFGVLKPVSPYASSSKVTYFLWVSQQRFPMCASKYFDPPKTCKTNIEINHKM